MKPYAGIYEREDIQENAFNALAYWLEICNNAHANKDVEALIAGLQALYVYVHVRIEKEESEKIRAELGAYKDEYYSTHSVKPTPLLRSELLDKLYDILLRFAQALHKANILYRVVVPAGEMSRHGTV